MEAMIGEIRMFGGSFVPQGWAACDGQMMSVQENPALFSILGTTYGGDGRLTFALPDLRGRAAVHPSQAFRLGTGAAEVKVTDGQTVQPGYLAVPFIIATQGVLPIRS